MLPTEQQLIQRTAQSKSASGKSRLRAEFCTVDLGELFHTKRLSTSDSFDDVVRPGKDTILIVLRDGLNVLDETRIHFRTFHLQTKLRNRHRLIRVLPSERSC
jgi:hypothetical protein